MLYNPLPLLLAIAGGYLLIKLRFFYILHPIRSAKDVLHALSNKQSLSALMLALAGTLGVGNVLGVAMGIIAGGAGSVFWLLVSAIPASVLKYSEVVLASDVGCGRGGMYWFIRDRFPAVGGFLSVVYATACLVLSFFMGASLQVKSVANAMTFFGVSELTVALVAVISVILSVARGGGKIAKITAIVIPVTTIIYILLTVSTVCRFGERLPGVISAIVGEAFSFKAGIGGVVGIVTSGALREGFSRGMLSNEAGAGTSTLAHSSGAEGSSRVRGLLGVVEVLFDTVILCSLTALAILSAVPDPTAYGDGMELVLAAVSLGLGDGYTPVLVLAVLSFAYSTVICWYYYGTECVKQLFGERCIVLFAPLFLAFVFFGAFISEWLLVLIADVLLFVMTLLTIPTLIKSSDRIVVLSELPKRK